MSTEGNLRFKIDWANLLVGSNFTVFALFYFVFEGNFPREAYIWTTSSPGRSSLALEVGRPHLQRPRKSALGTRLIFGGRFNGGRWAPDGGFFAFNTGFEDLYLEGPGAYDGLLEGLIFGILRYCPSQEPLLSKCILFSLYIILFHIFMTLMKKRCFHPYFRLLHERK